MREIIDRLIIVAGQWKQFGGAEYERQFGHLLNELAWVANTDQQGALEIFMAEIEKEGVAA